jgi:hypothetical protein
MTPLMTLRQAGRILNAGLSLATLRCARKDNVTERSPLDRDATSMSKHPRKPDHNVVPMLSKPAESRVPARDFPGNMAAPGALAAAGSPNDPRMQEAMRLIEAFLAIEDEAARAALIALAERLVSFDWLRKVQQR